MSSKGKTAPRTGRNLSPQLPSSFNNHASSFIPFLMHKFHVYCPVLMFFCTTHMQTRNCVIWDDLQRMIRFGQMNCHSSSSWCLYVLFLNFIIFYVLIESSVQHSLSNLLHYTDGNESASCSRHPSVFRTQLLLLVLALCPIH